MKRQKPTTKVRIELVPDQTILVQDPKRKEYHKIYAFRMFFDTHEQCTWRELVVTKGTKLYKRLSRKKYLPRMVFLARFNGDTYPIKVGRSTPIRRSHHLSYNQWPTSFVISVTWEKISVLDMIELLDKN